MSVSPRQSPRVSLSVSVYPLQSVHVSLSVSVFTGQFILVSLTAVVCPCQSVLVGLSYSHLFVSIYTCHLSESSYPRYCIRVSLFESIYSSQSFRVSLSLPELVSHLSESVYLCQSIRVFYARLFIRVSLCVHATLHLKCATHAYGSGRSVCTMTVCVCVCVCVCAACMPGALLAGGAGRRDVPRRRRLRLRLQRRGEVHTGARGGGVGVRPSTSCGTSAFHPPSPDTLHTVQARARAAATSSARAATTHAATDPGSPGPARRPSRRLLLVLPEAGAAGHNRAGEGWAGGRGRARPVWGSCAGGRGRVRPAHTPPLGSAPAPDQTPGKAACLSGLDGDAGVCGGCFSPLGRRLFRPAAL